MMNWALATILDQGARKSLEHLRTWGVELSPTLHCLHQTCGWKKNKHLFIQVTVILNLSQPHLTLSNTILHISSNHLNIISFTPQQSKDVDNIYIPNLQVRKRRLDEIKSLVWGHTMNRWCRWDLNSRSLTRKAPTSSETPCFPSQMFFIFPLLLSAWHMLLAIIIASIIRQ